MPFRFASSRAAASRGSSSCRRRRATSPVLEQRRAGSRNACSVASPAGIISQTTRGWSSFERAPRARPVVRRVRCARTSRPRARAAAGARPCWRPSGPRPTIPMLHQARDELAALRADAVEQLVERVGELLDALLLERLGDVVEVDAGQRELVEERPRLVDPLLERRRDRAVVLERLDRLLAASC